MMLLLGYFFILGPAEALWKDHWLVKDGQPGIAFVTQENWAGHDVVDYRYRVGQKMYTGQDSRSFRNPEYAHVMPGQKTIVYYSSSHPWLSAIDLPQHVGIPGLPVVLFVWLLEACFVITLINPESPWAFRLNGRRGSFLEREIGVRREVNTIAAPDEREEGGALPVFHFGRWRFFKDKVWLVTCALLIVVGMAAVEIALDAVLGGR